MAPRGPGRLEVVEADGQWTDGEVMRGKCRLSYHLRTPDTVQVLGQAHSGVEEARHGLVEHEALGGLPHRHHPHIAARCPLALAEEQHEGRRWKLSLGQAAMVVEAAQL